MWGHQTEEVLQGPLCHPKTTTEACPVIKDRLSTTTEPLETTTGATRITEDHLSIIEDLRSTTEDHHLLTITGQPHLMATEEAGTGGQVMDREDPGAQRDQEDLTRQEVPLIVGLQGQEEGGLVKLLVATGTGIELPLEIIG